MRTAVKDIVDKEEGLRVNPPNAEDKAGLSPRHGRLKPATIVCVEVKFLSWGKGERLSVHLQCRQEPAAEGSCVPRGCVRST